jgi:acetyl esterase/lipase
MTERDFPKPMTLNEYLAEMDPELRAAYPAFIPLFENWPQDAREARKDLLRDDGITYPTRLMHSRVRTELHVYAVAFHGFENMVPDAAISQRATADYVRALRDAVGDVAH